MKKIQVSSVEQTTSVQVVFVNAYLIAKAIRAQIALNEIVDEAINVGPIQVDDGGRVEYAQMYLSPGQVKDLYELVYPFLNELTKAFEED